jgi:acylphosphatase
MGNICKRFIVSGKVQGVFYRHATKIKAAELKLTGWVRNLENGTVELLACGEPSALDLLENWLWKGPPTAHVTEVKNEELDWQEFFDFQVT